jgi:hypothetical protein
MVVKTLRLGSLRKKLRARHVGILVAVFFLLFSLRVLNWFEYPYVLISGDFRPPLTQEAFTKRVMYTWDETDFGMPSVYAPRILVPSYFFMTVFQALGANLYVAQMMALLLMCFLSSILMFIFTKRLTNGNVVASFVTALYLTSNLYMINDREVTAIAFLDEALVILPCLITFAEGIMKRSSSFMAVSGLLFVLTYGSFPNFRVALLCVFSLVLVLLFIFINSELRIGYSRDKASKHLGFSVGINSIYEYLKRISVFIVSALATSIWILTLISTNFIAFFQAYGQMGIPSFILDIRLHDVLRLITKWGFYSGDSGKPYIPYADTYLHNPSILILSYLPPILAFASLLLSKPRRLTVYFSAVAALFLMLASGFSPLFTQLYPALATNIPLMIAFRESAQWSFFVIISYSILIGVTFSTLYNKSKNKALQIVTIGLAIILLLASAYPLTTGDVTRNWLNPNVKGYSFPHSYAELNDMLSNQYWALLLPQRNTYVIYDFSGIPFTSGNPYPLIFSKPIISGLGTEYLQSENSVLLDKVHALMLTNGYENVAPEGNASASSAAKGGFSPAQAIDGDFNTRWASKESGPQWFEIEWNQTRELSKIRIIFWNAYANDYTVETWNGFNWTTRMIVQNNTNLEAEYVFSQLIPATRLRINFTKALSYNFTSIWELEVTARTDGLSKFLGVLSVKYLILEKDLVSGSEYDTNELSLDRDQNFTLAKEWDEVALYSNTNAQQKLYAAANILNYKTLDDMFRVAEVSNWKTLQDSAFSNSTSMNGIENTALVSPKNFMWDELSPTSYVVHVESTGAFVLVLSESFDERWKVSVNGNQIQEKNHQEVNAFANGWLVDSTGNLTITIQYETQNILTASIVASISLSVLLLVFLNRKGLKKIAYFFLERLRSAGIKLRRKM